MKNILFLGPQDVIFNNDGGKKSILGSIINFAKKNKVYYAFPIKDNTYNYEEEYSKYNIQPIFFKHSTEDTFNVYFKSLFTNIPFKFYKYFSIDGANRIIKCINDNKIDIVILNHAHMGVYFDYIIKNTKAKVFLREHNIEYELVKMFSKNTKNIFFKLMSYHQYVKTQKFERALWNKVFGTFFISDSDYEEAKGHAINLYSVYDGIDSLNDEKIKNIKNIKNNYFLFSGSLKTIQNLLSLRWFLNEIWFKLPYSVLSKYSLYITGTKETDVMRLLNLSKKDLENYNIKLKGYVDNYIEILKSSFALVSPTVVGSGVRIKVIESMINKKLVFCSQIDIEMLTNNKDMITAVQFDNLNDFISKLLIVEEKAVYDEIVNNAYAFVKKDLAWDEHVNKIIKIIS